MSAKTEKSFAKQTKNLSLAQEISRVGRHIAKDLINSVNWAGALRRRFPICLWKRRTKL